MSMSENSMEGELPVKNPLATLLFGLQKMLRERAAARVEAEGGTAEAVEAAAAGSPWPEDLTFLAGVVDGATKEYLELSSFSRMGERKEQELKAVIVESPYAGDVEGNLRYLRACLRDCLLRGEAPFASHALYTQPGVLDDEVPAERELGIRAGFFWRELAEKTVVYTDRGTTKGMTMGIEHAQQAGRPIEYRELGHT